MEREERGALHTVLDLFSGCGGFSLGAHRAGFRTKLAIDIDPVLTSSFHRNFRRTPLLLADIAALSGAALRKLLPEGVEGVIGGPPCQAFSEIGRRVADDPRRTLVGEFFRLVAATRPSFFVMENVRGLGFPKNREVLESGLEHLGANWTILGPVILNAADFGAPTSRRRLFLFGFDRRKTQVPMLEALCLGRSRRADVRDAIGDLLGAREIESDTDGRDRWEYSGRRKPSSYARTLRSISGTFTGHRRTAHGKSTIRRFAKIPQGAVDLVGKHPRLEWSGLCPTLRAGTGNDRGKYQSVRPLHPTENRVITYREGARLQGFPDDFLFHPTVWHSFRMIGNSVSPIIAEAIMSNIMSCLAGQRRPRFAAE